VRLTMPDPPRSTTGLPRHHSDLGEPPGLS
jgi:hypothetical protein